MRSTVKNTWRASELEPGVPMIVIGFPNGSLRYTASIAVTVMEYITAVPRSLNNCFILEIKTSS